MMDVQKTLQPDDLIPGQIYRLVLREAAEPVQSGTFLGLHSRRGLPLVLVFLMAGQREKHFAVSGLLSVTEPIDDDDGRQGPRKAK